MSYTLFILSLLSLCASSIAAFICAFKNRSFLLGIFVPLIALCGSFIYFSYTSVLGYPVHKQWDQLSDSVTVVYFRVVDKETITLWTIDGQTTRVIELPYNEPVENALEAERSILGKGIPVTFKRQGQSGGQGTENTQGVEDQEGTPSDLQPHGWRYKVESRGDPIPGGSLPPKTE